MKNKRLLIISLSIFVFIIVCKLFISIYSDNHTLSEEQIEDNICTILYDRYSVSFEIDSYEYKFGWSCEPFAELPYWYNKVEFLAHPVNNPAIRISGQHIQAFHPSNLYEHLEDNYVGALVANEENRYISELLGDDLGDVRVKVFEGGYYYDFEEEISGPIYEMIRDGTFTLKRFYAMDPLRSLCVDLYIDKSEEVYIDDPKKEYEIIENVGNQIIHFFREEYGLDIYIALNIFFYKEDDYNYVMEHFEDSTYPINWPVNWPKPDKVLNKIYLGEVPDNWVGIKSLEEYIESKEAIK